MGCPKVLNNPIIYMHAFRHRNKALQAKSRQLPARYYPSPPYRQRRIPALEPLSRPLSPGKPPTATARPSRVPHLSTSRLRTRPQTVPTTPSPRTSRTRTEHLRRARPAPEVLGSSALRGGESGTEDWHLGAGWTQAARMGVAGVVGFVLRVCRGLALMLPVRDGSGRWEVVEGFTGDVE